jgi:outer membrane lipoprotein carrier protein
MGFGVWLLLAASACAQTPAEFAAAIDRHYNSIHSLQVHFTQRYDGLGMHRVESGVLLLEKPGRMRWTYEHPAGKLFVLDGHDAYFYTPGQSEAQRVPAKKLDDLRSPLRLLLGHAQLAKELSGLTLSGSTLSGVPRGLERRVTSLAVTAKPSGEIESMRVEETDGAVNVFELSGEQVNPREPADAFVFHAPAGVDVVSGMPPL